MATLTKKQKSEIAEILGAVACVVSYLEHPKDEKDVKRALLHAMDAQTKIRIVLNQ